MRPEKSIKRLIYRFEQALKTPTKSFKIYQEDIDSIKDLAELVAKQKEENISQNQLYFKLYVYLYTSFATHYSCGIDNSIIQKEINKILDRPLEFLIMEMVDVANLNHSIISMESLGIKSKHPLTRSDVENKIFSDNSDKVEFGSWDFDKIIEKLKTSINSTLNKYQTYRTMK